MASLRVLDFDHEGRLIQFDTWLDDQQLYLLSDSRDSVSLFDHMSGAATAPPATADSATRSQWLTCDAAARLAIRNHLPLVECANFGQHRTALALYDAVVACYSSPATAALDRLLLPYLFPEMSAFATVEDLVSHLRTSDACYRAAAPAEFLDRNQPSMFITLYFIVTRLPDSLHAVGDHFRRVGRGQCRFAQSRTWVVNGPIVGHLLPFMRWAKVTAEHVSCTTDRVALRRIASTRTAGTSCGGGKAKLFLDVDAIENASNAMASGWGIFVQKRDSWVLQELAKRSMEWGPQRRSKMRNHGIFNA
ncbi:unnamed protein product [Closterium sp. NIES-53]